MDTLEPPRTIFVSCHSTDRSHAATLESLLPPGSVIWNGGMNLPSGESWKDELNAALARAEVVALLLGPKTRDSRWVDYEIQHGTAPRSSESQPAGQASQSSVLSAWGHSPRRRAGGHPAAGAS